MFEIAVSKEPGGADGLGPAGHYVQARSSRGKDAGPHPLDLDALRDLGGWLHPDVPAPSPRAIERLGRRLYQAVFRDDVLQLFREDCRAAAANGERLPVRVRIAPKHPAFLLPWELLHNGQRFLAHNPRTPVLRLVGALSAEPVPPVRPPLRVLSSAANAKGNDALRLAQEQAEMLRGLFPRGDLVRLVTDPHADVKNLMDLFTIARDQGQPFHVWHHGGHGAPVDGRVALVQPGCDKAHWAPAEPLAALAAASGAVHVALIHTCHSAEPWGLATLLARHSVPLVSGFVGPVTDAEARTVTATVAARLLRAPVEDALTDARLAVASAPGVHPLAWARLVVFSSVPCPLRLLASGTPSGPRREKGSKEFSVFRFDRVTVGGDFFAAGGDMKVGARGHRPRSRS